MKIKYYMPPRPILLIYDYNHATLFYQITCRPEGFNRLPEYLDYQPAKRETIKQYADFAISSPLFNGEIEFHTRLDSIPNEPNIYIGDDHYKNNDRKNLILFSFYDSENTILVWYFKGFYPVDHIHKKEVVNAFLKNRLS